MNFEDNTLEEMRQALENVLKKDSRFGPLHRLEINDDDELLLSWDNASLRPKSKATPGPYLEFMESIADCLSDFGYCLAADEDGNETMRNNYFYIVPDDGSEDDE